MLWLKTCPKCSGDLHQREDQFGSYIVCLQCGRCLSEVDERDLEAIPVHRASTLLTNQAVEPMAA